MSKRKDVQTDHSLDEAGKGIIATDTIGRRFIVRLPENEAKASSTLGEKPFRIEIQIVPEGQADSLSYSHACCLSDFLCTSGGWNPPVGKAT